MRIAYFTDTFLPQVNGVATALANQASELGARGHSILIFTPKLDNIKREKFKAQNVQVVHLPTVSASLYPEFKMGIFGLPKVIKYLILFKPDIIHLHTPLTVGMDAVAAARFFKKPLVGTVHIYFTDSNYLGWLKYRLAIKIADQLIQRVAKFMFNQCDLILVPSKTLMKELGRNGLKKPVSYLPNGVSLEQLKTLSVTEKEEIKKKMGLKEKVVLHFGRLSHEKNIDLLIKSFHLLAQKHQNISLLIIGDGPTKEKLVKLVKKLGIEKMVTFTGFIDHQLLMSSGLLSVADVFATASTMENNPMAVLEAMMFGLPIVGVKQAGLIELVSSNGFLVQPDDIDSLAEKIEEILFDEKSVSKMGKESLEQIKPYSIDKVVDKLLGFYRSLPKKIRS